MRFISPGITMKTLKLDLVLRFTFLLSAFLIMLIISYAVSSTVIAEKENDSIVLNLAGQQRMLIHKYVSEINQVLVGLASSDLKMILAEKKKADLTAKYFEKKQKILVYGGELVTDINDVSHKGEIITYIKDEKVISVPPQKNEKILYHMKQADKEWNELKRISLLSLRSNAHSISSNPYVHQLLDQATKSAIEMNHVAQLMLHVNNIKLKQLDRILLSVMITGSILFILLVYYVYSRIILPLDHSVSELKFSSEKLQVEKVQAEKANQAKSEFLSRMSHELRTPMNAILGFGQVLELNADGLDETQRGNVREILDAGYHLLDLINEVLDLAKIESGKMEVSMEGVSVNDVLQQSITLVSSQLEARQLELIDHVSSKGYKVHADFTRLKQVMLNLLSNAVKYNRDYGQIRLDSEIIGNKRLRICLTDTGEGLTKEELSKLFVSFERLNAANNVEGSGIGLVISKHLVELMGGSIGVESTPREGSVFWIELALSGAT